MDRPPRVNEFGHYSFLPFLPPFARVSPFSASSFFPRNFCPYNYKVKIELVVCNSIPYCRRAGEKISSSGIPRFCNSFSFLCVPGRGGSVNALIVCYFHVGHSHYRIAVKNTPLVSLEHDTLQKKRDELIRFIFEVELQRIVNNSCFIVKLSLCRL